MGIGFLNSLGYTVLGIMLFVAGPVGIYKGATSGKTGKLVFGIVLTAVVYGPLVAVIAIRRKR